VAKAIEQLMERLRALEGEVQSLRKGLDAEKVK
jgi:hypothetical protein